MRNATQPVYYLTFYPLLSLRERLRRTLREWLVLAVIVAVIVLLAGRGVFADGVAVGLESCILWGLMSCLPLWLAYRLARFIVGR